MLNIDNELCILEKYKLTPTELFTVRVILLAKEDGKYEYLQRFSELISLKDILTSLQNKEIILKSWKMPKSGEKLIIEDIPFNKNFQKQFFRASFKMGEELFNAYPSNTLVNGQYYNLRTVSKKFDSIEDACFRYGKYIKNNPEVHAEIIDLIEWGKKNDYPFVTLDRFIVDRSWQSLKEYKENNISRNVNDEAVVLI